MKSYIIACQHSWCNELAQNLRNKTGEVFHLISNNDDLTLEVLEELVPDHIFFPHWSHIIPTEIYTRYECIIFHMTDLPYGRGGSPLQNLIVRGHQKTMLSALRCVSELDAGPIYFKESMSLLGSAEEIYLRTISLTESMICRIIEEKPTPVEQEGEVTLFKRRKPEQGDWSDAGSLGEVFDRIRMLDAEGYPPAFVRVGKFKLEFNRASRKSGSVIADVKITQEEE